MLAIRNVTKIYGGKTKAVNNLNLEVNEGEIFGFIGPNGAGKTTTIKMITGMLKPTNGNIFVDGISVLEKPVAAKRKFTFVPDHPEIFDAITGFDYLNFLGDIYKVAVKQRKYIVDKYAVAFGIDNALGQAINSYSHGMKQKLLICGALLPNPRLFILDEPLVGLDPKSARMLKDVMIEHCENGGTVFFSSHVLEVVENLCDRIAIINNGSVLAVGTVAEIKDKSETLEDVFLELTKNE